MMCNLMNESNDKMFPKKQMNINLNLIKTMLFQAIHSRDYLIRRVNFKYNLI